MLCELMKPAKIDEFNVTTHNTLQDIIHVTLLQQLYHRMANTAVD